MKRTLLFVTGIRETNSNQLEFQFGNLVVNNDYVVYICANPLYIVLS